MHRGIIENASGRNTLGNSLRSSLLRLLTRPHQFITSKPFALIFVRISPPASKSLPPVLNLSTDTLCWHIPYCQRKRHHLLHDPCQARVHHHLRRLQIRRYVLRQPRSLPLQRQELHPALRRSRPGPTLRASGHVSTLHRTRLPDYLRLVQPPAAGRSSPRRAPRRRVSAAHQRRQRSAVPCPGDRPARQHTATPAWPRPIQPRARVPAGARGQGLPRVWEKLCS